MSEKVASKILCCGVHADNEAFIVEAFNGIELVKINSQSEFEAFLENPIDAPFPLVVCGETIEGLPPSEMAQTFRMSYQEAKIFYVSINRTGFVRETLLKNGFDDAFLMPFDRKIIKNSFQEIKAMVEGGVDVVYKPVKVVDLKENSTIDFDVSVYLPTRKKVIKYAVANEPLDAERVKRLNNHNVTNMYVDSKDIKKFYKYSAGCLKDLGKGGSGVSETERVDRLERAVRTLFTGIFQSSDQESSIQEGKEMLANCAEIVQSYILDGGEKEWYAKIRDSIGAEGDTYTHHSRVSTFAAMFSIGLEIGRPEDMATAGLFHDIGTGELPEELQRKEYNDMSPKEKELWAMHPSISVKLLKMKKIALPQIVYDAIEQHHERFNASGFPKGITTPKLRRESMILGMADEFDYLTCAEQMTGGKQLKPVEAIKFMEQSGKWEPEMIAKLKRLFPSAA